MGSKSVSFVGTENVSFTPAKYRLLGKCTLIIDVIRGT